MVVSTLRVVCKTLQYAWLVHGTRHAPPSTFVIRHGCAEDSDMYRISLPYQDPPTANAATLQSYQLAFLTSPLFGTERVILHLFLPREKWFTLHNPHMHAVASGEATEFGLWVDLASEGDAFGLPRAERGSSSATRVMRASMPIGRGRWVPIVDSWWSVECNPETQSVDLIFGSALIQENEHFRIPNWLVGCFLPFHGLYSRLLLACARANWEEQQRESKSK
eukprot:Nitzschia sp. Nitz4//scaffold22_size323478//41749//42501//NITZ4_000502-RA/size323478-augustus-gene-0.224-mRNA-1//-1//CDS//3329542920//4637//frame0